MKARHLFILGAVLFYIAIPFNSSAQPYRTDKESARVFVQRFYNWYNKLANAEMPGKGTSYQSPYLAALKQRPGGFSVVLRKASGKYFRGQPKQAGEITGLDFDPVLAAQDIGFDYQAGKVKQVKNSFFVDVHSATMGMARDSVLKENIAVVAEVSKVNGHWQFKNFYYPELDDDGDNLLNMLKGFNSKNK